MGIKPQLERGKKFFFLMSWPSHKILIDAKQNSFLKCLCIQQSLTVSPPGQEFQNSLLSLGKSTLPVTPPDGLFRPLKGGGVRFAVARLLPVVCFLDNCLPCLVSPNNPDCVLSVRKVLCK